MGVETAMAVGSIAASGIGAAASFTQARKQKELMKDAQREAEQAMADARAKLDVNYYEQLAVPMGAYYAALEASRGQAGQATAAGVESERGVAATAGRVQMAENEFLQKQRSDIATQISDFDKLKAAEESRLAGLKADLDISQATAAQKAAKDAASARARAMQQGFASVASAVKTAAPLIPLYLKTGTESDLSKIQGSTTSATEPKSSFDWSILQGMSNEDIKKLFESLSPEGQQAMLSSIDKSTLNPFELPQ
jgi:hypothetical protein